jgi:hypothetical protein
MRGVALAGVVVTVLAMTAQWGRAGAGDPVSVAVLALSAALIVLATYSAGSRFGARIGLAAAVMVASSPPLLGQIVRPTIDVVAAALWLTAVAAAIGTKPRLPIVAGLASSAAILVRPGLVPLGLGIGLFLLLRPERTWPVRVRAAATYVASCLPGALLVAIAQPPLLGWQLPPSDAWPATHVATEQILPNIARYGSWLWHVQTPAIALAALAPVLLPGPLVALFLGLFAINLAAGLPFLFEGGEATRLLLPTLPLSLILVAAGGDAIWRRLRLPSAQIAVAVMAIVLSALFVLEARTRGLFQPPPHGVAREYRQ